MGIYKTLQHTADIGIEVLADNLSEAFCLSVEALVSLMIEWKEDKSQLQQNQPVISQKIVITGGDWEDVLVNLLTEVLYYFETQSWIAINLNISTLQEFELSGTLDFLLYDEENFQLIQEIKAITYHKMIIDIKPEAVCFRFYLDL